MITEENPSEQFKITKLQHGAFNQDAIITHEENADLITIEIEKTVSFFVYKFEDQPYEERALEAIKDAYTLISEVSKYGATYKSELQIRTEVSKKLDVNFSALTFDFLVRYALFTKRKKLFMDGHVDLLPIIQFDLFYMTNESEEDEPSLEKFLKHCERWIGPEEEIGVDYAQLYYSIFNEARDAHHQKVLSQCCGMDYITPQIIH